MRAIRILTVLVLAFAAAARGDTFDDVRTAIASSIEWQERWFGQSFGASCVRAAARRGALLHVLVRDSEFAPSSAQTSARSFVAYVDGTNVLYTGKIWDGKVYAEPSAGDPTSCEPGEIANQTQLSHQRGALLAGPFSITANRTLAEPSQEQMVKIDKMARRSVEGYLSESAAEHLRIANYRLDDPALIVLAGNIVLLVNLPPVALIDDNTAALVFSGEIFLGPDASADMKSRVGKHIRNQMKKHSRQLS